MASLPRRGRGSQRRLVDDPPRRREVASLPRRGRGSQQAQVADRNGLGIVWRPFLGGDEDRNYAPVVWSAPPAGGVPSSEGTRIATRNRAAGCDPACVASLPRRGRGSQLVGLAVQTDGGVVASLPRRGRGSQHPRVRNRSRAARVASLPRRGRGSQRVAQPAVGLHPGVASLPRRGRGSQPYTIRPGR